jgi:hypothetical protein
MPNRYPSPTNRNLRIDCCKRSSNGLGCVIQPCYEIGALLFLTPQDIALAANGA